MCNFSHKFIKFDNVPVSEWDEMNKRPFCDSEDLLTASHHGSLGSIPGQSICGVWWTKWHWDRFSPNTVVFPCTYAPIMLCSDTLVTSAKLSKWQHHSKIQLKWKKKRSKLALFSLCLVFWSETRKNWITSKISYISCAFHYPFLFILPLMHGPYKVQYPDNMFWILGSRPCE